MGTNLTAYQTTFADDIALSGIGVHTGQSVSLNLKPAGPNTGIIFRRIHDDGRTVDFPAVVSNVGSTDLCTLLGDPSGDHVATVEHIMAAFSACCLDNVIVEIDGTEVPIMDGSSRVFVDAIDAVGLQYHLVKRSYVRVLKTVRVEMGGSWAEFTPHEGTRFEVAIDFDTPLIGRQDFNGEITGSIFRRELASARTFGFMKDVERLWASGHALGSSLENSVVISDDHAVINGGGLRYEDEFVRHKTLDAVGDLALAGAQFIGCFTSYRGGHRLNSAALKALIADSTAYEIVEAEASQDRVYPHEFVAVAGRAFMPWSA